MRENFVRALVFLALSSMRPLDRAASGLQELDSEQVILRLQRKLLKSADTLHITTQKHVLRVSLIRHVLAGVNGPREKLQEEMLDLRYKGTQALTVIGNLFVTRSEDPMGMDLDAMIPVLSATRVFGSVAIDRESMAHYARPFQHITSLVYVSILLRLWPIY